VSDEEEEEEEEEEINISDEEDLEFNEDFLSTTSQPQTRFEKTKVVTRNSSTPKGNKKKPIMKPHKNLKRKSTPTPRTTRASKVRKTSSISKVSNQSDDDDEKEEEVEDIQISDEDDVEEIPPVENKLEIKSIAEIDKDIDSSFICEMKAPVTLFSEPIESHLVRDIDERHSKNLYNEMLTNPQNHLHRTPFIINLLPLEVCQEDKQNASEMAQKIEDLRKRANRDLESAKTSSNINTGMIQQEMLDLMVDPLFYKLYSLEVIGGNHSRACYQRLISEMQDRECGLSEALKEKSINLYTGIIQYTSNGKPVHHCVDAKIFFNLSMLFVFFFFYIFNSINFK